MPEQYRAAVVQLTVEAVTEPSTRDAVIALNRERALAAIERLILSEGPSLRLVVLPVCQLQAPLPDRTAKALDDVAIALPGPEVAPLVAFCQRHSLYLASSCIERFPPLPGWRFHSGFILGPDGVMLRAPKAQARTVPHLVVLQGPA